MFLNAGNISVPKSPIIAMTINNSVRVNPGLLKPGFLKMLKVDLCFVKTNTNYY